MWRWQLSVRSNKPDGKRSSRFSRNETEKFCRSQWLRGLSSGSAGACFLGLRLRIPSGGMDICFLLKLCVLSPRGLWDGPIAHPKQSYRTRGCITERDLEMSRWGSLGPPGLSIHEKKKRKIAYNYRRKVGLPPLTRNDICRMLVISPTFWTTFWYQIIENKKKT